ncbi:hypothetical protein HELRODRAFT_160138 [Helobdella robusta]|uniref:Endonuclease/exonuclease/phosphatase domain-containing protein n=1 Tax=Helobdella robusta TaxID=6412 RepID=T1EPV2_HELRO|nr:hypothetical protein HELRODRAFT_160138 [Helobdella robusta]ESO06025.1 hypothetical protein HELRODRAFT_160138 [Helobdella robusta]
MEPIRPIARTTLQSTQLIVATPPPCLDVHTGFLSSKKPIPASLLRFLLRAGIESNPGPKTWISLACNKKINKTKFSTRCRTCCKWFHLVNCVTNINEHHIHIAVIQESKYSKSLKDPVFRDRGNGQRDGLLILIHYNISYTIKLLLDQAKKENQAITVRANDTCINIVNIYIPPESVCPSNFTALILQFLTILNLALLGDVNAHDKLWHSSLENSKGRPWPSR